MKKMMYVKYVIAAIAVISFVGLTSCTEKVYNPVNNEDDPTNVPNDFDFSTKKNVEINLKYDVPTGYRVPFQMYTKSPLTLDNYKSYIKDSTLVPFLSGKSDENGLISFKGEIPATVNEIYAYSIGIGVPVLMKASVSSTGTVSKFEVAEVLPATDTRAGDGPSGTTSWQTYSVTLKKPELSPVSRTITTEEKSLIDKSFPSSQGYEISKTYYQPSIKFKEKAEVNIYSVSNGNTSDRTNALAYFVYNKEKVTPDDINSKLDLIFPELNKTTPAEGKGFQLLNNGKKEFEAGTSIGFALFPGITPNNIETKNTHVLYSCFETGSWNTYSYPNLNRASVPHMVLSVLKIESNGNAIIAISFEDQPWATNAGTNKGDFRDDTFILEVNPASSLPDDLPTPPKEDEPSEPSHDYKFISSGILCFEDCWPKAGDYDINDVVISYESLFYIKNGGYVAVKEKYTFLHNGASYVNGFGYQLMGARGSSVKECVVSSDYSCVGQGMDATSDGVNIMLFDNAKQVKRGTIFNVLTTFNDGAFVNGINPFIVANLSNSDKFLSEGRTEVHLPTPKGATTKYLPTSKVNGGLWGTEDDRSVPASKIYYVRGSDYPFALDIKWESDKHGNVNKFVIPAESKSIENTYPEFTQWVKSKGKEKTDWFTHPVK